LTLQGKVSNGKEKKKIKMSSPFLSSIIKRRGKDKRASPVKGEIKKQGEVINHSSRTILNVSFCQNRDKYPNFLFLHFDLTIAA
jgi:hypothetical protein